VKFRGFREFIKKALIGVCFRYFILTFLAGEEGVLELGEAPGDALVAVEQAIDVFLEDLEGTVLHESGIGGDVMALGVEIREVVRLSEPGGRGNGDSGLHHLLFETPEAALLPFVDGELVDEVELSSVSGLEIFDIGLEVVVEDSAGLSGEQDRGGAESVREGIGGRAPFSGFGNGAA